MRIAERVRDDALHEGQLTSHWHEIFKGSSTLTTNQLTRDYLCTDRATVEKRIDLEDP